MLDEIIVIVIAGRGGDGAVSFRREKYVPRGGPDGGDGGDGGNVIVIADAGEATLDPLARRKTVRAKSGGPGRGAKRHGERGVDVVLRVPAGTAVWGLGEGQIADLRVVGMSVVIAKGGLGGKGNARMARAERRTPRIAERGLAGEQGRIRLELRLLAEAGLVGLPNAGKSSLLQAISSARPKVGAYPFTTLEPYLGVVERGYDRLVVADVPGLIEGAHEGAGLGVKFLRHVERTLVLLHVVDVSGADPHAEVDVVRSEMEAFGQGLSEKRWLVALNKIDLPGARARAQAEARRLRLEGIAAHAVSALTGEGVDSLVENLFEVVAEERARAAAEAPLATVLRPRPARRVQVEKQDGAFIVRGEAPERAVAQLGVEPPEARVELARRLRRMGVDGALKRAGVKAGDRIRIGEAVLEWPI